MKRVLLIFGLLLGLLGGWFVLTAAGGVDGRLPCPSPLILDETPDGWDFHHDHYNGCRVTLFNQAGERAPEELYEGLRFEYPGSPILYPVRIVAIVLIVGSAVGMVRVLVSTRQKVAH